MLSEFVITFRESLEAALIAGIVLSYLIKTRQPRFNNTVYLGIVAGIVASVIGAFAFSALAGGFEGSAEQLFEGITMLVGAILLTTMILWMMQQSHIAQELHSRIDEKIMQAQKAGIFALVFVAIFREGIETVIFLGAVSAGNAGISVIGAMAGIIAAIFLGYLIFVSSLKIDLKKFFNTTSIVLILFAAGLIAHGIHEFQEAGAIGIGTEEAWNLNPAINPDGSFPLLHEKGLVGSFFRDLLGYNGNPSVLEVFAYIAYLVIVVFYWKRSSLKKARLFKIASGRN